MLSDQELDSIWTDAFRSKEAPSGSSFQEVMDATREGGVAALRAVEAAVRADQIEKDAAIAESLQWSLTGAEVTKQFAAAIRAQLPAMTEGNDDE